MGPLQTQAFNYYPNQPVRIRNISSAYTVTGADAGFIINCTANAFTITLTSAATLGRGFNCWIWDSSGTAADAITIDPNGAETIDGQTTIILRPGEGCQIVCDGANWQTGDVKRPRTYTENVAPGATRPIASGTQSLALGAGAQATNTTDIAMGNSAVASGGASFAVIYGNSGGAGSVAIGRGSAASGATTAAGASGAVALGSSYASGTNSFAVVQATNTSTYGAKGNNSIALGYFTKATANHSIAMGGNGGGTTASGDGAVALGGTTSLNIGYATASGVGSFACGDTALASGQASVAIGYILDATQTNSVSLGTYALSNIIGKYVFSSGRIFGKGDSQYGLFVIRCATTNATATVLTTNNSAASTNNQIILPNNSAYAFTGTVIARQQAAGGSAYAAWEIKGAIIRSATAASTTIGTYNINTLSKTAGASAWAVALSADTTNGGLAITATGAAATNIYWVATVQTSEVTYA